MDKVLRRLTCTPLSPPSAPPSAPLSPSLNRLLKDKIQRRDSIDDRRRARRLKSHAEFMITNPATWDMASNSPSQPRNLAASRITCILHSTPASCAQFRCGAVLPPLLPRPPASLPHANMDLPIRFVFFPFLPFVPLQCCRDCIYNISTSKCGRIFSLMLGFTAFSLIIGSAFGLARDYTNIHNVHWAQYTVPGLVSL